MEATVKKYQQKFKKVKDDMDRWDDLHARLLSQFRNASSIIGRLQLLDDPKNYGFLKDIDNVKDLIFGKQMESLQMIMLSMNKTLEELNIIILSLAKTYRDAKQQLKGGSIQFSTKQLNYRIGVKPSIADCLEGLRLLHEMHQSEYLLKSSVISALAGLALNPSVSDLQAFEQLLVDQPNIPKEEDDFDDCNPSTTSYLLKKFVDGLFLDVLFKK
ncbi:putative casein Kinase 2 substrate [Helianthus annuus]|nr:putative casein Kinase 2 substrate [Helianthus annuus]KAJ0953179.1 putative casein Kinase 2 substrate [Helianthus annuus]